MLISLIAAMDEERGIGREGNIPWRLPADLKRFKAVTLGHHLIMGRKTFETIGKPLPGRTTIIVTRQARYRPLVNEELMIRRVDKSEFLPESSARSPGAHEEKAIYLVNSFIQALDFARRSGESEVFVAGGGEIYAQAIKMADALYITIVHGVFDCDVFFPEYDLSEWDEKEKISYQEDDHNPYASEYIRYKKRSSLEV